MLKILVIGNGFDKAHGLKTGYEDFLNWVDYISKGYDIRYSGGIITITEEQLHEGDEFNKSNPKEYQEIVKAKDNFWIAYFNSKKLKLGDRWLDFETEIETFTKKIYKLSEIESLRRVKSELVREANKALNPPNFVSREALFEWLYAQLRNLTRMLEIYLCKCANRTINDEARLELFTSIKANKLISFNYTSTYRDVYNPFIKTDYIHGKAILEHKGINCNLVLGFDDHYMETTDTITELIPFEKYYQRIVYRNDNNYFKWMETKGKDGSLEQKEIHIFGHSLSPADGDIIKLLIEAENTRTKIYYRREYEQERANMIKNLAIILTPNGLISRVGGSNPTIEMIPV